MAEHQWNEDQLMARALNVCWHSPTSDRWPCTVEPFASWQEQTAAYEALAAKAQRREQLRERLAAWEFARHAPARYWDTPTLPDATAAAYEAADELLALLDQPDGPMQ